MARHGVLSPIAAHSGRAVYICAHAGCARRSAPGPARPCGAMCDACGAVGRESACVHGARAFDTCMCSAITTGQVPVTLSCRARAGRLRRLPVAELGASYGYALG